MSWAILLTTFRGYVVETTAYILNLVTTKKVAKTTYEMWSRTRPSLEHIKVWGCKAYVLHAENEKLEPISKKCYFIGYPKNYFVYLFYKPSEKKVFDSQRRFFLERYLISKEGSGSQIKIEEIQKSSEE